MQISDKQFQVHKCQSIVITLVDKLELRLSKSEILAISEK
jgi:hypothetical protein